MHVIRLPGAAMLQIVEQHQHGGAGKRDRRRLEMKRPGEHKSGQHRCEHDDRAAQQHPVGHHAGRVHPHDEDAALRARAQRAAPDEVHERRLHDQHDQSHRRDIDEKGIEAEARLRADQYVGRIADQGRGAADIRSEDLGKQERIRRQFQFLGDHQRHRHDQKNRAHVVEDRREDRGRELQHEQDAGRVRPHPLRRGDGEILKQPRAARDRDQDHHAGQEPDRIPIDALDRLALVERADDDDDHRADQRHDGMIERTDDDEDIGDGKHRQRHPHRVETEEKLRRERLIHAAHFAMKFPRLYCAGQR